MNKKLMTAVAMGSLLGVLFMLFSKVLFFTGMFIAFAISVTQQVSASQNPDIAATSASQSKFLFISVMSYVISGILTLMI